MLTVVVCDQFKSGTNDDKHLFAAFVRHGIEVQIVSWSDSNFNWAKCTALLLRSTFDYVDHLDVFQSWIRRIQQLGIPTFNSPETILWNSHKRYLLELVQHNVCTVPTALIASGSSCDVIEREMRSRRWENCVLKPAVGSFGTGVVQIRAGSISRSVAKHINTVLTNTDLLLQPFISSVRSRGEVSLIFVAGKCTHAVLKTPAHGEFKVQGGDVQPLQRVTVAQMRLAQQAVQCVPGKCVYARVDMLLLSAGKQSSAQQQQYVQLRTADAPATNADDVPPLKVKAGKRDKQLPPQRSGKATSASGSVSGSDAADDASLSAATLAAIGESATTTAAAISVEDVWAVTEVEVLDPELFWRFQPAAADALVQAVVHG
eukprot:TRINITY_DN10512_c0_g1_i1.p1 TRINITY_DN10512_c0_g1~~TRINITY_DN10512_c0_g1_i1.p1  ORF type:complete len:374 (+),score=94.63 TRINITY_DN10512_c0_g1_i1:65-1186(+)